MKSLFVCLFILIASLAKAQIVDTNVMVVHKDWRVDELVQKQLAINTSTRKDAFRTKLGYRLLVLNTNSRDEAIAAKTKI